MKLSVQIQCSNCGHRSRKFGIDEYHYSNVPEEIVEAGWNSFGSAFYCRKCCETWEKRNGKDRPLWGKEHTKERVYQEIVSDLLGTIHYLEKGEYDL